VVSGRHAVPLGLVLHELVTNAVKYGAWAAPGGLLDVRWEHHAATRPCAWCGRNAPPRRWCCPKTACRRAKALARR
jgi:two-component sensor histidine kinase